MSAENMLALRRGLVYEGDGNFFRAIHPIPVLTRASCDWTSESCEGSSQSAARIFREDSFDPITRIRRGRLYCRDTQQGARTVPAENVHNYPFGPHIGIAAGQWDADGWYTPYRPSSPEGMRGNFEEEIRLGDSGCETLWRVIQSERILTGDLLFTLRAVSFLSAIPRLSGSIETCQGDPVDAQPIHAALDRVVDAFYAHQPQPVVDVCRESARVILAAWVGDPAESKDLGPLIHVIPETWSVVRKAAFIVSRLHPRGKSSEQERQDREGNVLRPVVDEDAEASVHLLGLILREIGWAA